MAPKRTGRAPARSAARPAALLAVVFVAALWSPAAGRASSLRLTRAMARAAIRAVLASDHARATTVDGCRRASGVAISCDATEERLTPPSITAPAVYEILEGRFTVTLERDHGRRYMRVHEVR
jgi:glycine/D-amino acid oxidase-like deaminating enzyme